MPFLASGSYGCLYKPHLKCTKLDTISKIPGSTVGKIFGEEEDYRAEKKLSAWIQKIDPKHEFTLPYLGHCMAEVKSKDALACEHIDLVNNVDYYQQIIHKYGGKDLLRIMKVKKGSDAMFKQYINILLPIIRGVQKINQLKYAHLDIKPDNILFDGKKMYLIDFGLLKSHKSIYVKNNNYILSHNYPFYPPEFKAYVNTSLKEFVTSFYANFYYTFTLKGGRKVNISNAFSEYIDYSEDEQRNDLRELFKKKRKFSNKIDTYSLGILLLLLYIWCGVSDKRYAELIKNCLCFDPTKRFTLKKLSDMLEHIGSADRT